MTIPILTTSVVLWIAGIGAVGGTLAPSCCWCWPGSTIARYAAWMGNPVKRAC